MLTAVLFLGCQWPAGESSINSGSPSDDSRVSTTVFEITTTTLSIADEALATAYSSCKNWREHELVLGDILFAAYPYTNEKETSLRTLRVVSRSLALMKQAADLDKSYSIYV